LSPAAATTPSRHLGPLVALVVCSLVIADRIAVGLGLGPATGTLCLATLGSLVIATQLGWRQALLGAAGLTLLVIPAVLSQGNAVALTGLMAGTALAMGFTARWQLQPTYWLMVVSLCVLISNPSNSVALRGSDLPRLLMGLALCCGLSIAAQATLLAADGGSRPGELTVHHSWRRCLAYGLLLTSTTVVTTLLALGDHWHMRGLWLMVTPFLVLRPFVRDAWKVALHRSLGTLAGVLLVMALAGVLPQALPLQVPAVLLATLTVLIVSRRGHPALMLMALTATIVLFDSSRANLLNIADERVQATALGIAISLTVMALAHPIEQRLARRRREPPPNAPAGHGGPPGSR
jgi:Fusaric acid resistance protein-like